MALIQSDFFFRRKLSTQTERRWLKSQGEDSHLQAKERGLRGLWPCGRPWSLAFRIGRRWIATVSSPSLQDMLTQPLANTCRNINGKVFLTRGGDHKGSVPPNLPRKTAALLYSTSFPFLTINKNLLSNSYGKGIAPGMAEKWMFPWPS